MGNKNIQTQQKGHSAISIKINTAATALKVVNDTDKNIMATINRLSFMLGRTPSDDKAQLTILINFIKEKLSNYTTQDLNIAIELLANNQLDFDISNLGYSYNSGYFWTNLMQSYSRFRAKYLNKQEPEIQPKEKERMNNNAIQRMYDKELTYYENNGILNPDEPNNTFERIYNWLKKNGKITFDEGEREETVKQAEAKWRQYLEKQKQDAKYKGDLVSVNHFNNSINSFTERLKQPTGKSVINKFAKIIKVERYFSQKRFTMFKVPLR